MKKPLVIFGNEEAAEVAHYYFAHDSDYQVCAFTVDAEYLKENSFCGQDVLAFEELAEHYPAKEVELFIAIGYSALNRIRKEKYEQALQQGYELASYISSRATVLNEGRIGKNCFILEDNTVQPFARIGNNVTLWSGNHIGHHAEIGDHTFIASHAVVSGKVVIGEQCFIGVNATLRDHIRIGDRCVIGAGALILEDADAEGVYVGNRTQRSRIPSKRLKGI